MKKIICIFLCICSTIMILVSTISNSKLYTEGSYDKLYKEAHEEKINKYSIAYIENEKMELIDNHEESSDKPMIFEAASNGKLIAAYISLKLAQEGRISLDDNIIEYLDEKDITDYKRFSEITIRDLLRHSAGFSPNYEVMLDKKIYFEPGSRFSYSGVGYIYLQKIIENVTQMRFEEVAKQYVFIPLDMSNTTFEKSDTVTPYMRISNLLFYVLGSWIGVGIIIFIIQFIIKLIKHDIKIFKDINSSLIISAVISIALFMKIAQRIVLPAFVIYTIYFATVILLWNKRKIFYVVQLLAFLFCIILSVFSSIEIPIGMQITNQAANAAYSMKSTNNDMGKFVMELIKEYNEGNQFIKEMNDEQISIDDHNGWGLGFGISYTNDEKIAWHTGINFGMQSLVAINFEKKAGVVVMTNSDKGLKFAKDVSNEKLGVNYQYEIPRNTL